MISWLGSSFVAAQLLSKTKYGNIGPDSVEGKLYRKDQMGRVMYTMECINNGGGATEKTVNLLQKNYFTDVSPDDLLTYLQQALSNLEEQAILVANLLGMDEKSFGNLSEWPDSPVPIPSNDYDETSDNYDDEEDDDDDDDM